MSKNTFSCSWSVRSAKIKTKMKVQRIAVLFSFLFLVGSGCSRMFAFLQRDPYGKEERKLFVQEELYVIDGKLYLKAIEKETGKIAYVEIRDYLRELTRWELRPKEEGRAVYGEIGGELKWKEGEGDKVQSFQIPKVPPFLKRKLVLLPLKSLGSEAEGYDVADAFYRFFLERSLVGFPVSGDLLRTFLEKSNIGMPKEVNEELVRLLGKGLGVQYVLALETYGPFRLGNEVLFSMGIKGYETLRGSLVFNLFVQKKTQSPAEALGEVFEEALLKVEGVLEESGWFSHIVWTGGEETVLLAGKSSGLGEGDVLTLFDPLKGQIKGKAKVKTLLGDDLCVISKLEGFFEEHDIAFFEPEEKG